MSKVFEELNEPESERSKILRLLNSYADRISMAGLHDARRAPSGPTKAFWVFALLSCQVAFLYESSYVVIEYTTKSQRFNTEVNIKEISAAFLPFPNVTICAPAQVNVKRAAERIVVPPDAEKYVSKRFRSREELIEAFLVYVAFSSNEKPQVEENDHRYFDRIWTESIRNGYSAIIAINHYFFNCSQVIESCAFDGEPFDCCEGAVKIYADDAVCFTLRTDKKIQAPYVEPWEKSGLEVDVSADWRNVLRTYNDMTDGAMIQVGSGFSPFSDAVGVPNGMQVTIRLTATKKSQPFKCINDNATPPLKYFSYYDPHGHNCHTEEFMDAFTGRFLNCLTPYGEFVPNDSISCNSQQGRILHDAMFGKLDDYSTETIADRWTSLRNNAWLKWRLRLRHNFYSGRCLPFCTTWEYTMHIGYAALTPEPKTVHPEYSRSRIKVFFADDKYTQLVESPAFSYYILFAKVGAVAALYVGLSVIGIIELLAYGAIISQAWTLYKLNEHRVKTENRPASGSEKMNRLERWTSLPYRQDTVKSIRIERPYN